ncbi:MAG: hypothetical protein R3286_10920 [Gammaproteobacteria bacterium]|nr:hypothetical protein [Gammaproteobacteria bacterium]
MRHARGRIPAADSSAYAAVRAALALLVLAGAGCAGDAKRDGLDAREFARVEGMALYRGAARPPSAYQVIDEIEGVSCNRFTGPPSHPHYKVVTEYEALFDLRLEAADLGADAVVDVACSRDEGPFGCSEALVCRGAAVRLDDGVGLRDLPQATAAARLDELSISPRIYESLTGFTPDYLTERQRAVLGTPGVSIPVRSPGYEIHAPATGGAAAAQGAGQWFLQCLGQGGSFGLLVSPVCAAIGGAIGTFSAESEAVVSESSEAIAKVLADYYRHESLRDRMVRAAAQAGAEPALAAGDAAGADSIIEVGLEEMLLPTSSPNGFANEPVPLTLRARVRVYRRSHEDGTHDVELYNRSYHYTSERHRYARWGENDAALLRHTLEAGFDGMAERMVEDLLLVYPLMPVFGATGIDAPYRQRRYRITPVHPPAHSYDFEGRPWPARLDSFTPVFRWREFPDETARSADFQGKLGGLSELRYDLRLYRVDYAGGRVRLVLERNGIAGEEYALEQPLAPDTRYVWTIRARFRIEGGERVTRWSGDWLTREVKGFYFRTAD